MFCDIAHIGVILQQRKHFSPRHVADDINRVVYQEVRWSGWVSVLEIMGLCPKWHLCSALILTWAHSALCREDGAIWDVA